MTKIPYIFLKTKHIKKVLKSDTLLAHSAVKLKSKVKIGRGLKEVQHLRSPLVEYLLRTRRKWGLQTATRIVKPKPNRGNRVQTQCMQTGSSTS